MVVAVVKETSWYAFKCRGALVNWIDDVRGLRPCFSNVLAISFDFWFSIRALMEMPLIFLQLSIQI